MSPPRVREMLARHPELRRLSGPEPRSVLIGGALVVAQAGLAALAPTLSWSAYAALVYAVGATLTQALFLLIHEVAGHDLALRTPFQNRAFALVLNLPLLVPFAVAFREYHKLHHTSLGREGDDMDLPSAWERAVFNRSRPARAMWLVAQLVAYALRPCVVRPQALTGWHLANAAVQLGGVYATLQWGGGWGALRYLACCLGVAGGLHPTAGHFVAEHYDVRGKAHEEARGEASTFSYYGPLNCVTFNVGYHREHHDFPTVPWSRLRRVRSLAPEYYPAREAYDSWIGVLCRFVMWGGLDRRVVTQRHASQRTSTSPESRPESAARGKITRREKSDQSDEPSFVSAADGDARRSDTRQGDAAADLVGQ